MNTGILTDQHYPGVSVSSDDCIAAQYNQKSLSFVELGICSNNGYAAVFAPSVALQFAKPVTLDAPLPQVSRISEPAPVLIQSTAGPVAHDPTLPPPPMTTVSLPVAVITNDNLTQPLPDITVMLRPRPPVCSGWEALNGAINDHPLIALAVLGATLAILWGPRGR